MSRSVDMIISQVLGPGIHTEDGLPVPIPYRQTPAPMNGVAPTTPSGAPPPTGSTVGRTIPFPR